MLDVGKILEMSLALTSERDYDKMLKKIITCAMELTNCEGGTLYLYRNESLEFMVMRNIDPEVERRGGMAPPVAMDESKACAYSAIRRTLVNVPDVYAENDTFDFSGPKIFDKKLGCHTKSMLVFPLVNHEEKLVGVVQLLNARDKENELIAFTEEHEMLIRALASMAAISLSNMQYIRQIKGLLHAVVNVFTNAIDTRTPYNYYHSKQVHDYVVLYMSYCNALYEKGRGTEYFDAARKEQLQLAALMHDIGKLVTPTEVMNKETRLAGHLDRILHRFRYIGLLKKVTWLEGACTEEEYRAEVRYLQQAEELVLEINRAEFLEKQAEVQVKELAGRWYTDSDGGRLPYLEEEEQECLLIPKGTLTGSERQTMNRHVEFTDRFLTAMNFDEHYKDVRAWAGKHHEYLNGTGYPRGLSGNELPTEVRLLTIVDVFDALVSDDRPYKKAHTKEDALRILSYMEKEGKIDGDILKRFEEAIEWKAQGYCLKEEGDGE